MNRRFVRTAGIGLVTAALGASTALITLAPPATAATPASHVAYIVDGSAVEAVDTRTNQVVATISLPGHFATGLTGAITPNGKTLYVSGFHFGFPQPGDLWVIDTATNTVTADLSVDPDVSAGGVAVSPDGTRLYVGDNNSVVHVYNTADNSEITSIELGGVGDHLAVTPDGRTVYAGTAGGYIDVIDTATNTLTTTLTIPNGGAGNGGLVVTPDGKTVYAAGPNFLTTLSTATNTFGPTVPLSGSPFGLAMSPDGTTIYTANNGSPVSVVSTAGNAQTGTVAATGVGVGITPDGRTAIVAGSTGTTINTATQSVSGTFAMVDGHGSTAVAVMPDQGPVAALTVTPAPAGSATTFDASGSGDPDGTVAAYSWSFGDGATATTTTATTSHTYKNPGSYTATVTVTDDAGCSTSRVFTGQTVSCNGSAAATAGKQFTVSATGALQQLQALVTAAAAMPPGTSLLSKASAALLDYTFGNINGACTQLNSLINEATAQIGSHLTSAQAAALIASARQAQSTTGC